MGFFTTLPVGRDYESFEALRRNLWILPIVGTILGLLIAIPSFLLSVFAKELSFLSFLIYLAFEGINHVDGLADFGDAFFAPRDRKVRALKDMNTGVGGTVFVCVYVFTLMWVFRMLRGVDVILATVDSQMMAKFGMLLLLTTTKPVWEGMASHMMEFAGRRDLLLGSIVISLTTSILAHFSPGVILVNLLTVVLCLLYRRYVVKTFGGVNGDVIGALNCISFAFSLILFSAFLRSPLF